MQYNDLLKKKEIVENDKTKIVELIEELDQKKNEALKGAHERVNKVCMCVCVCVCVCVCGGMIRASVARSRQGYTMYTRVLNGLLLPSFLPPGFWVHLLHSAARHLRLSLSLGGADSAGGARGQGGFRRSLERESSGAIRRTEVCVCVCVWVGR